MAKPTLAIAALAMGFAVATLPAAPAQALSIPKPEIAKSDQIVKVRKRGIGRGEFGHRRFGSRGRHFRRGFRHRRSFGPHIYIRPYYGYRSCYWLKRRAIRTGSRYWWRRYQRCRYGF